MDIDSLKSQWRQLTPNDDLVDGINREMLDNKGYKTRTALVDRLKRRRLWSVCICLFSPLWLVLLSSAFDLPLLLYWLVLAYFLVCGCYHFMLYRRLGKMSVIDLPVSQALVRISDFAILRRRFESLGTMLALLLVAYLLWVFRENDAAFEGGVIGAVVGTAIAVWNEVRTTRDIRRIKESLRRNLECCDDDADSTSGQSN